MFGMIGVDGLAEAFGREGLPDKSQLKDFGGMTEVEEGAMELDVGDEIVPEGELKLHHSTTFDAAGYGFSIGDGR